MLKILGFMAIIALTFGLAFAEEEAEIHEDAGTTGAAFLKLEPGCRPMGMGGAFVGLADDVNALFWNPAGLVSIENSELSAMQNFSFGGVNNVTAGYARRIDNLTLGVSIQGVFAEIERRSAPTTEPEETFYSNEMAVGISGGFQPVKGLSVGVTGKYIHQGLDEYTIDGVGADIGARIRLLGDSLSAGAMIQNIGWLDSETDAEKKLPSTIRAGASIRLDKGKFNLSTELAVPFSGDPSFRIGAEKWVMDLLALRVGYNLGFGSAAENPTAGLTAGVGLKAYGTKPLENVNFQFDYAYLPDSQGDSHRISFITRF